MTILLKTPIPGPRSQSLFARRQAAVPQSPFHVAPLFIERTEGATVTDVDGNVLLDFTGGLGTLNAGHSNPAVVEAVVGQARQFLHTCFHIALYEPYVALAEKLNAITPGRFPKKTLLLNSGAEAVENAVKIARCATKRPAVVGFEHGFAGRTLLTMSLTGKVMPYKAGFGPFAPEIYRLPYPYAYRSQLNEAEMIDQMRGFFDVQVDPRQVACVVMELVTGEGGFIVAPQRYVQALVEFCRASGILFVADEIQSGLARTGRMFATEHYGIEPDLMTMGKSLAGGMPLAAVTGRADLMDSVHVGGLGGTYGGNPVACAAALATLAQLEKLNLCERAEQMGQQLRARLDGWQERLGNAPPGAGPSTAVIGEVRGLGAMMAAEFVQNPQTKEPAKEFTQQFVKRCVERGLIVLSAGTYGNVLRFLIPLVASREQIEEGLGVLESVLFSAR